MLKNFRKKFEKLDNRSTEWITPEQISDIFRIRRGWAIFWLESALRYGYLRKEKSSDGKEFLYFVT